MADAGYESEENYLFIEENEQLSFIKPANYEISKTGYISEKSLYSCEDCSGCPFKEKCIKGDNCKTPMEERTKQLQVSKKFKETDKKVLPHL